MQPRSWLNVTRLLCLTVAALVCADLVGMTVKVRATAAPITTPREPGASASAAPLAATEQQAVADSKSLLGQADDITRETHPVATASGAPNASPTPEVVVPEPAQSMSLIGTMVNPGTSIAVLMLSNKETVVREGDMAGTFKVVEIRDASVIMEMNGQRKTLWMPSLEPPHQNAPALAALPPPPVPKAEPPPSGPVTLSKSERDQVMSNLNVQLAKLRIIPFRKSTGEAYGSKVEYVENGSFLNKMGLRQGDILLQVNGRPVNTPEDGMNVFQTLTHEDRVVLKVDRNGAQVTQEVDFQ